MSKHFDYNTPETGRPFLVGYRKFALACAWFALAVFAVLWSMIAKSNAGQITLALWVVGTAGFFGSVFVLGNAAEWVKFWRVETKAELSQKDSRQEIVYQDSNEDAAWKDAEKSLPK